MELTLADLLTVGGLSLIVTLITQLAKQYLPERQVPLFAVAVGVAIAVAVSVVLGRYGVEAVAQAILTGFLGAMAATGIYELQKPVNALKPKAPVAPDPPPPHG